jgi:hypothetical protein
MNFCVCCHHYPGSSVDLRAIAQEDADDVGLVGPGGQVEGRLAPHGGHVGVGLVLDQVDDYVHAAHEAGHVQWRQPRLETNKHIFIHGIGVYVSFNLINFSAAASTKIYYSVD